MLTIEFTKGFPFIKLNRGVMNKAKDMFVSWRSTYSHGMGYYDLLYQPAKVIGILVAIKYFSGLPNWVFAIIVPFWFAGWTFVGYMDRYHIKIWQRQAEWASRNVNPFEIELMKRIKRIEKMLCKKK